VIHAKEEVQRLLKQLPENVTFDDIQYHIYVHQKINRGLADIAAGRTISEEEFDRQMSQWLEP
jgi:predicted transcriptional regulator